MVALKALFINSNNRMSISLGLNNIPDKKGTAANEQHSVVIDKPSDAVGRRTSNNARIWDRTAFIYGKTHIIERTIHFDGRSKNGGRPNRPFKKLNALSNSRDITSGFSNSQ
jgi:hypothetical protein